jgi:hypothetical protein
MTMESTLEQSVAKAGLAAMDARSAEIEVMRAAGCTEYLFSDGVTACSKDDDYPCDACVNRWRLVELRNNARKRMRRAADRAIAQQGDQ